MRNRESGRERGTKSGSLTRREALYALGAAGGLLAAPRLAWSAETAASEDAATTTTEAETPTFSMTTTTADGITVKATAKPKQLGFIVEGPIRKKVIPLAVAPKDSEGLTEAQRQQKEAALKLLHVSGDFMTPLRLFPLEERTGGSGRAYAYAAFMFLGEKDPERVIGLTFTLKDKEGKELATSRRDYRDARALPTPTVEIITGGDRQSVLTGYNYGVVRIGRDLVDAVHRIDLTFIDGGLPKAEKK